jgi:hypothetical protein
MCGSGRPIILVLFPRGPSRRIAECPAVARAWVAGLAVRQTVLRFTGAAPGAALVGLRPPSASGDASLTFTSSRSPRADLLGHQIGPSFVSKEIGGASVSRPGLLFQSRLEFPVIMARRELWDDNAIVPRALCQRHFTWVLRPQRRSDETKSATYGCCPHVCPGGPNGVRSDGSTWIEGLPWDFSYAGVLHQQLQGVTI